MKQLPRELWKYFWEVKSEEIDVDESPDYVISRVMDYGDTQAVRWMKLYYGQRKIENVLRMRRGISRQSAIYWATIFEMDRREVKCLQTQYRQIPYGV
jgi:hypothetical protein